MGKSNKAGRTPPLDLTRFLLHDIGWTMLEESPEAEEERQE